MDCPKCAAPNPEDAAFCSLCHEFFKPKKAKPAEVPALIAPLMTPRVEVQLGDWAFVGPMVSTPEALYFFIESSRRELAPLKRIWATALGASSGLLVGAAVDTALDNVESRVGRPKALTFGPVSDVPAVYVLCPVAQDSVSCRDYFVVRREQARAVSMPDADFLVVEGEGFSLEAHGPLGGALLSGTLRRWGYQMDDCASSARRRRGLRMLGWVALVLAVAAAVGEFLEVRELALHPFVQSLITGHQGQLSVPAQYVLFVGGWGGIAWLCWKAFWTGLGR